MSAAEHQLAQVNVARLREPLDAPETAEFVANLEPVNALADAAPGFVWRLQTEDGDATAVRVFDDDMLIVNMSVWQSLEALSAFVYGSGHREVLRRRREWFDRLADAHVALWWIETGTRPTVAEAERRLVHLRTLGPTPVAFTFRVPFPVAGPAEPTKVDDGWSCPTA